MGNHFHLVIETPNSDLPRAMQQLNGGFARVFNRQHTRTGHLFRARYTATTIESDEHLAAACKYVLDNPVRAGILPRGEDWPWSSIATRGAKAVGPAP